MKKTYIEPVMKIVTIESSTIMDASHLEVGGTTDQNLSRRRHGNWEDDEEEDEEY